MKRIFLMTGFIFIAIVGYFGYKALYPKPMPKPLNTSNDKLITYSLLQIAEHGNKDSCWMALDGKVYDVTPFVKSGFHPGKDAILEGCGKDATTLFNTRPMGSGTSHSDKARNNLPKYMIGELTK